MPSATLRTTISVVGKKQQTCGFSRELQHAVMGCLRNQDVKFCIQFRECGMICDGLLGLLDVRRDLGDVVICRMIDSIFDRGNLKDHRGFIQFAERHFVQHKRPAQPACKLVVARQARI